jgi:hypothetical protein
LSELKSSSDAEPSREIEQPQKTTLQTNHEAARLAQLLKAEILRNKPDCKITQSHERSWTVTADRMIRLDHRTPDAIAALIQWAQHDEFWCPNVLSMGTLREKFDQLELRRKADSMPKKSRQEIAVEQFDRQMEERRRDAVNS